MAKKTVSTRCNEDIIKAIDNEAKKRNKTRGEIASKILTEHFTKTQQKQFANIPRAGEILRCPHLLTDGKHNYVLVDLSVCQTCTFREYDQNMKRCESYADHESRLRCENYEEQKRPKNKR